MYLDRGRNAQKSLLQSISRHSKFRVTDTASYKVALQATKNLQDS